jgi:hypothetical protein
MAGQQFANEANVSSYSGLALSLLPFCLQMICYNKSGLQIFPTSSE